MRPAEDEATKSCLKYLSVHGRVSKGLANFKIRSMRKLERSPSMEELCLPMLATWRKLTMR